MSMNLSSLPSEIVVEILLFAAYRSSECVRALALTSSWTNKLVEGALYSTVSIPDTRRLKEFIIALGLVRMPFPRNIPVIDLFRSSFNDVPELSPTQYARNRARLVQNLWLIPLGAQERYATLEDHIYIRLMLQLCLNVRSLAITGTTLSHFLLNKAEHFRSVTDVNAETVASGRYPYPHLSDLTLLDSTPALIMDGQYARAEEGVRIFNQLTHFTTYGFFHRNGLPVPIHHFTSLTHAAFPLMLSTSVNDGDSELTSSEIFENTGGWGLLKSAEQIQMIVFLFPMDGRLNIGSHVSTHYLYYDPVNLISDANRLHSKAYALPIDGLHGLQNQWSAAARGGPSIWELAKSTLRENRRRFERSSVVNADVSHGQNFA